MLLTLLGVALVSVEESSVFLISPIILYLKTQKTIVLLRYLASILTVIFIAPLITNISYPLNGINIASLIAMFLPSLAVLLLALYNINFRHIKHVLILLAGLFGVLILGSSDSISPEVITDPYFRMLFALITVLPFANVNLTQENENQISIRWVALSILSIAVVALYPKEIDTKKKIVFDESHGEWESVTEELNGESFGRDKLYNYVGLKRFLLKQGYRVGVINNENEFNSNENQILIVKMPTSIISDDFSRKIESWVGSGGGLLIIADHTNLYESSKIINDSLGEIFKFKIGYTATFNRDGMPVGNEEGLFWPFLGGGLSIGENFRWQTGSSLSEFNFLMYPLASFRNSFSEEAVYSHQNRFGDFYGELTDPFISHPQAVAFPYGSGVVGVFMDSTPFSTFSMGDARYQGVFMKMLDALSSNGLLLINRISGLVLLFLILMPSVKAVNIILFATMGFIISTGAYIHGAKKEWEYDLQISIPSDRTPEYLNQLKKTGQDYYSRLISSFFKYNRIPKFGHTLNWLVKKEPVDTILLSPSLDQLPKLSEIKKQLLSGSDVLLFFEQWQFRDQAYKDYLESLGFNLFRSRSTALKEFASPALQERDRPEFFRYTGFSVGAKDSSVFFMEEETTFLSVFLIRPRKSGSGRLVISTDASQYSDDSIGSIWEGKRPSTIGIIREKEVNSLLESGWLPEHKNVYPLVRVDEQLRSKYHMTGLLAYKDGKVILKSLDLNESFRSIYQQIPIEDFESYIKGLAAQAIRETENCFSKINLYELCNKRFISEDLTEWEIAWKKSADNSSVLELIHEKRFSGMDSTWNILIRLNQIN